MSDIEIKSKYISVKTTCVCGGTYTQSNKRTHERGNIHKKYLETGETKPIKEKQFVKNGKGEETYIYKTQMDYRENNRDKVNEYRKRLYLQNKAKTGHVDEEGNVISEFKYKNKIKKELIKKIKKANIEKIETMNYVIDM